MVDFFSRYHFRSFLESFTDPVWVVNRTLRLIYMNPAALKKFSLRVDYAIGKLCHQALFENPANCPFCTMEQVFLTGESTHGNFTLLDTDGRNHVYELSHEIRNPLNSIDIQMSLLQRMAARFESEEADAFLRVVEVVRAESRRLNSLAGDFLKMQQSRCLTLADCDPFVELKKVVEVLREEALSEAIEIRLNLENRSIKLRADCEKLQQAFMNLMKNAFEALLEGKTEDPCLKISGRVVDNRVLLSFADNGPGIPFASQVKIFDLFYTTKACGTGIGLHLCRDVIKAHDGELSFVSDENGTIFTIVLPLP